MDLDSIQSHVSGLMAFKHRIEQFFTDFDHDAIRGLSTGLAEIRAEIEAGKQEVTAALSQAQALRDTVETAIGEIKADVEVKLAPFQDIAEWFTANKQALETLLSLGDDLVVPGKVTAAPSVAEAAASITPRADEAEVAGSSVHEAITDPVHSQTANSGVAIAEDTTEPPAA